MGIMNQIKGGTDLTKPRVSGGYVIGSVLPVIVLLIVFAIAVYLFGKGKTAVSGVTASAKGGIDSVVGVFGNGT